MTSLPYLRFRLNALPLLISFASYASAIFIPLLVIESGGSRMEVGIVGAVEGIAYFVSSLLFGRESDKRGRVKFIQLGLGTGVLAFLLQITANNLTVLMIARGLVGFCIGITSAALLAYVYESQKAVGRFGSYGSLGWVFAALSAAIIKDYHQLFLLSSLLSATGFLLTLGLKEMERGSVSITPQLSRVIQRHSKVYIAFFLRHLGASALWVVLPLLLASLGADKTWIGIISSINFLGQFVAMRYVERFKETRLFPLGLILSGIVFLGYASATHYLQLVPVQALLSIAWSCLYIGALLLLMRGGEERGTSSGVLYSTMNLCAAAGPFLGGALAQWWGFRSVALFAAALSFSGVPLALKLLPRPALTPGETSDSRMK